MKFLWEQSLAAARARVTAEPALQRRVRRSLRSLWDAVVQLEAATSPFASPAAVSALRRDALRLAAQAVPFPSLADSADARLSLTRLMEHGLDEVPESETAQVLALAREAHQRALDTLEVAQREEEALLRRRQVSLGTIVLAVALMAAIGGRLLLVRMDPVDLSAGKPFSLSSKLADCHPDQNECANYPTRIFFHTLEDVSPWYQVDLGAPAAFSSATLINRQDMGMARALPLVVEVSDDGMTFREVARRVEPFTVWNPTFPSQTARYFRVRVDRRSMLHLEAVRVHP